MEDDLKYVLVSASSLISDELSKSTKLVVDFAQKKLKKKIRKNEDFNKIEEEVIEQLKAIYPNFALVQRDLNYDLLNVAIQNLLEQARDAMNDLPPPPKKKADLD